MPEARLRRARAELPAEYRYNTPRVEARALATCPLCEELLTVDHDCEAVRPDADVDQGDLWGV